jgi:hypothetical protein
MPTFAGHEVVPVPGFDVLAAVQALGTIADDLLSRDVHLYFPAASRNLAFSVRSASSSCHVNSEFILSLIKDDSR